MKKKIFILGKGQFGRFVYNLISEIDDFSFSGFIVKNKITNKNLINETDFFKNKKKFNIFPAVGDLKVRSELIKKIIKSKNHIPNIIHPNVETRHIKIGYGVTIFQGALLSAESELNNHITIGFNSVIGHHSTINNFCFIGSGVVINGCVKLAEGVFCGANSSCFPSIEIGKYSTIAMGSSVMSSVKDGKTMIGVPAKAIF